MSKVQLKNLERPSPSMGGAGAVAARELRGFTKLVLQTVHTPPSKSSSGSSAAKRSGKK